MTSDEQAKIEDGLCIPNSNSIPSKDDIVIQNPDDRENEQIPNTEGGI